MSRLLERAALAAMEAIASASAQAGFTVSIAIVDAHGDLVAARRMDGARPRWMRASLRKAYTAAVMDRDTDDFHDELVRRELDLSSYGDGLLTALPGGVVVEYEGRTLAGIGVTGKTGGRDAEFALLGSSALCGACVAG